MKFLHFNQIRHNSTWTIHVRISQKMQQKVKNHLTFKTISTQANFAHMSFTWISPEIHIKWAYTALESKWISCEIHINLNSYEWNCHVFTTKWSIMHMSKHWQTGRRLFNSITPDCHVLHAWWKNTYYSC